MPLLSQHLSRNRADGVCRLTRELAKVPQSQPLHFDIAANIAFPRYNKDFRQVLQRPKLAEPCVTDTCPGITFVNADNLNHWLMDIEVLDSNPIYEGKTFRLNFRFSPSYPIEVCSLSSS